MKLTRMIFEYWKHWLRVPDKTILWSLEADQEGPGERWFPGMVKRK